MYEVETNLDRRSDPAIKHYLAAIGRHPLLSRDQEEELAQRIRSGDGEALDTLINSNLRFVVSVAKRYLNRGLSFMDLVAEGNVGLITAARRFDGSLGNRFVTYAVWWIRQSIQEALQNQVRLVRLPANQARVIPALLRAEQSLLQSTGGAVQAEDLARELDLPLPKLMRIQAAAGLPLSLDVQGDAPGGSLADSLADKGWRPPLDRIAEERLSHQLAGALGKLESRERDIVARHYGLEQDEGASLEAIGRSQSLSRERVRQLRNRALEKIRGHLRYGDLGDHLN
jgi:RNA polymerase primary sigma factor